MPQTAATTTTPTREEKINAATTFLRERLQQGIVRTPRDTVRAHMKRVFGPHTGIRDDDLSLARTAAAKSAIQVQKSVVVDTTDFDASAIDDQITQGVRMYLEEYPEFSNEQVYEFLVNLWDQELDTILETRQITVSDLNKLIQVTRDELHAQWSKSFHQKTPEEHKDMVSRRYTYLIRVCLDHLRKTGDLPMWRTLNEGAKAIFGSTPHATEVSEARTKAKERYDREPKTSAKTPSTNRGSEPDVQVEPWFSGNYTRSGVDKAIKRGIRIFNELSPSVVGVIVSWMHKNVGVSGRAHKPGPALRRVFQNVNSQITAITILFLCWSKHQDTELQRKDYAKFYSAFTGKGLGHYVLPIITEYVAKDATLIKPILLSEQDPTDGELLDAVLAEEEAKKADEALIDEIREDLAAEDAAKKAVVVTTAKPEEAPVPASVNQGSFQAVANQLVAGQQTQTDKILAAIADQKAAAAEEGQKTRAALEALGGLISVHNEALVGISDTLSVLDQRIEAIGKLTAGLVSTSEANKGALERLNNEADQPKTVGFNAETRQYITNLLTAIRGVGDDLRGADIPTFAASLTEIETRIVGAVVQAVLTSQGESGPLTLDDLVRRGASVTITQS